jgi:hypothetical protein
MNAPLRRPLGEPMPPALARHRFYLLRLWPGRRAFGWAGRDIIGRYWIQVGTGLYSVHVGARALTIRVGDWMLTTRGGLRVGRLPWED